MIKAILCIVDKDRGIDIYAVIKVRIIRKLYIKSRKRSAIIVMNE